MVDFPNTVYAVAAPGVEGDFATAAPVHSVIAGPGGLVAGAGGVTIGRFVWLDPANHNIALNSGVGIPAGIVAREMQGLITTYLGETGFIIPSGFGVTAYNVADIWVKNAGTTEAQFYQKVYANQSNGSISFGPPNSPTQSASATASIAPATGSFTGSIADNVLTITAVGSGVVVAGGTFAGAAVATGTQVVAQLTGTTGGVGTYTVSIPDQIVASTTLTETYGVMTVSAVASGAVANNQSLAGANVTAGSYVAGLLTGTGGNGTYVVSPTQTAASATVTASGSVETRWFALSTGRPGDIIKISNYPLG